MNFVKDGKDHFDRVLVSIIWFLIVAFLGNLCYWAIKYPCIPLTIRECSFVGVFSYLVYLIFRVLLVSFKSTFFEVKLRNEEQTKGTEKYLQWGIGKEPYILDSLDKEQYVPKNFSKEERIIYHIAENLVYETYSNRRFWNVFCPFIRTDELTLNEIETIENLAFNYQGVIRDKSNYNNILAYLQEITMFSLHLEGLKLQQHVREQVLNNSATLNRIDRLQKIWDRINLNLDLNFNATVRDNLLAEVDKSLNDVAKDFNEVSSHTYDIKEEILDALSNATNHLNELKSRLQTMAV